MTLGFVKTRYDSKLGAKGEERAGLRPNNEMNEERTWTKQYRCLDFVPCEVLQAENRAEGKAR
jgi:hypothetical protein